MRFSGMAVKKKGFGYAINKKNYLRFAWVCFSRGMQCPARNAFCCKCVGEDSVWTMAMSAAPEGLQGFYEGRMHSKTACVFVYLRSGLLAGVDLITERCVLLDAKMVTMGAHFLPTVRCIELRPSEPRENDIAEFMRALLHPGPRREVRI
jgi:hypothetical protein